MHVCLPKLAITCIHRAYATVNKAEGTPLWKLMARKLLYNYEISNIPTVQILLFHLTDNTMKGRD